MIETDALFMIADQAEEAGDYERAREGFARCAALGETEGLNRLAYMYDVGLGMTADKQEAMRLYRRAWRLSRSQDACAANNIAILYRERGDRRAMARWFARGAALDDGSASLELAKCYIEGLGVRRSAEKAVRCLAHTLSTRYASEDDVEQAEALMKQFRPRLA